MQRILDIIINYKYFNTMVVGIIATLTVYMWCDFVNTLSDIHQRTRNNPYEREKQINKLTDMLKIKIIALLITLVAIITIVSLNQA